LRSRSSLASDSSDDSSCDGQNRSFEFLAVIRIPLTVSG
jgi:hypothetical protein